MRPLRVYEALAEAFLTANNSRKLGLHINKALFMDQLQLTLSSNQHNEQDTAAPQLNIQ
jgi:hypothetical protein